MVQYHSLLTYREKWYKGIVSRDFLVLVYFMGQFPPSPRVLYENPIDFFRKSAETCAIQGARPVSLTSVAKLPVSTTTVANFATSVASFVDTGGKFATGVNVDRGKFATGNNEAGGKLPPESTTPVADLPPV